MAKRKRSLNLSKTELVFEDDKVIAIEHLKDDRKGIRSNRIIKRF